jgi:hypothetical protein
VPWLTLNGGISSHPLYAPMAHTQTTLPFYQHSFLYKAEVCTNQEFVYVHVFVWWEGDWGEGGEAVILQVVSNV